MRVACQQDSYIESQVFGSYIIIFLHDQVNSWILTIYLLSTSLNGYWLNLAFSKKPKWPFFTCSLSTHFSLCYLLVVKCSWLKDYNVFYALLNSLLICMVQRFQIEKGVNSQTTARCFRSKDKQDSYKFSQNELSNFFKSWSHS